MAHVDLGVLQTLVLLADKYLADHLAHDTDTDTLVEFSRVDGDLVQQFFAPD